VRQNCCGKFHFPFSIFHLIFGICHRQRTDQSMPNEYLAISGAMTNAKYQMENGK
jgi:hypothetical protein